jgi:hypothetical protein
MMCDKRSRIVIFVKTNHMHRQPTRIVTILLMTSLLVAVACNNKKASTSEPNPVIPAPDDARTLSPEPVSDNDTLAFTQVTAFDGNETNTAFKTPDGWEATSFETGEKINFRYNGQEAGVVDLQTHRYDGPGFSIYRFASPTDGNRSVLLVEAQADPGTAWYVIALVEKGRIVQQHFIDEPRSNSEQHAVPGFINVFYTKKQYIMRMKKSLVAGYSKIPPGMKEDGEYWYALLSR